MQHILVSQSDINYLRERIIKWGRQNYSNFPWRSTHNKWHALVAEIMLQRTRAEQVLPIYESFSAKYELPSDYLTDERPALFTSLGLHWREKELRKLAETLKETDIPLRREELLKLPGVGEYVASAFVSLHSGVRESIIDSNVVRLYGRFFGFKTDGETRRKKWFTELADKITPLQKFRDFNYGLIDFTRAVCKQKPDCNSCPLNTKCVFPL